MRIRPRTFSLYAPLALFLCTPGVGVPVVEESPPYLSPVALVADPQSKLLYIAEFTARQIAVFEIATERVRQIIPIPDRPSGMALSADGNRLYVTGGVAAGRVYVVDTRGGLVRRDACRRAYTQRARPEPGWQYPIRLQSFQQQCHRPRFEVEDRNRQDPGWPRTGRGGTFGGRQVPLCGKSTSVRTGQQRGRGGGGVRD